ncbi:helix-turn-helix transcriptional regulator [Chelativorans salis]|uniref:AraC family transcriptional regulator n=1 Tax=Chelativorans salis TaxID=2978478 RepID=A0ABT2LT28_9HYPH|nr:AraC family transcriptional regulator [Chelativorans sp. EGI FJ00035]MCT7377234.1 AraC family transcriptional regulator [Chelativorans sp. EGI FJ00035]
MTSSIKLFDGAFGYVSILNVASDLVTHAHEEVHIIIWLAGAAGEMTVGNERVRPGQHVAVGVNSLQPHCHDFPANGQEGRFLAFYIDPDWIAGRRGSQREESVFAASAIPTDRHLNESAFNLLESLTGGDMPAHLVEYETEHFIDLMFDTATSQQRRRSARARVAARDHRVRKAAALMKSHVCERTCLDQVARSVGLSRPHFFALFKEQMGLTPNVYWNSMRMAEAARQLRASEQSLIDIACGLGFSTQGNFSRFFRDHFGVPPNAYRSAARKLRQ